MRNESTRPGGEPQAGAPTFSTSILASRPRPTHSLASIRTSSPGGPGKVAQPTGWEPEAERSGSRRPGIRGSLRARAPGETRRQRACARPLGRVGALAASRGRLDLGLSGLSGWGVVGCPGCGGKEGEKKEMRLEPDSETGGFASVMGRSGRILVACVCAGRALQG